MTPAERIPSAKQAIVFPNWSRSDLAAVIPHSTHNGIEIHCTQKKRKTCGRLTPIIRNNSHIQAAAPLIQSVDP
jgi:hypothetical protein